MEKLDSFPSVGMRKFTKRCSLLEIQPAKPAVSSSASFTEQPIAQSLPTAAASTGTARSYSHSLFGQAMTGPDFKNFSTKYSLPQVGHFSAIGL